jgi:hypothetical protein
MRVFLSWSGDRSRAVAELLDTWLRTTVQACRPWISNMIEGGASWVTEINENIRDTPVGVLCLTKQNLDRPWVLFEAGAMARGLPSQRVIPLLIDIAPEDLKGPLHQFNGVRVDEAGIRKLMSTVNSATGPAALAPEVLERVFQVNWPIFQQGLEQALRQFPEVAVAGTAVPEETRLDQIIDLLQGINTRVKRLEDQSSILAHAARYSSVGPPTLGEVLGTADKPPTQYIGRPASVEQLLAGMDARSVVIGQPPAEWLEAIKKTGA